MCVFIVIFPNCLEINIFIEYSTLYLPDNKNIQRDSYQPIVFNYIPLPVHYSLIRSCVILVVVMRKRDIEMLWEENVNEMTVTAENMRNKTAGQKE